MRVAEQEWSTEMTAYASRWLRAIPIGLLVVAAATGATAFAEEQTADSPEIRTDIERLMELTGAYDTDVMQQMASMIAQQIGSMIGTEKPEVVQRCTEISIQAATEVFSEGDFMDEMNAIYAKYFSPEDIRQLITFYESPVGAKSIKLMPELMSESMQVTMRWMAKISPVIQERVTKQLREEGLIE